MNPSQTDTILSPNLSIRPLSARTNEQGHLMVGGCDTVELAKTYGTPLWVMDEQTIRTAAAAYQKGLAGYPKTRILYAGKALLCLAMCRLVEELGLGLDVVSEGELYTAHTAGFPSSLIYMHGNNKSAREIETGITYGVTIVVDNLQELDLVAQTAERIDRMCRVMFRLIPGVEPDTHDHIKTGQHNSKFGLPCEQLDEAIKRARSCSKVDVVGIHAHIGSQAKELEPYIENLRVLAGTAEEIKAKHGLTLKEINVGGGLAIAYTKADNPTSIASWAAAVAQATASEFAARNLELPLLLVEPGRTIVGSAGVTLYTVGTRKELPGGAVFVAVDGGMADNPRPITYQALYTAALANRMDSPPSDTLLSIVGKFCESGDIIIKESNLPACPGDLIAIFGTGAYNFSMASNYNRSPRPACVLVRDGVADVIVERESFTDLIRHDRIPKRLLR